MHGQASATVNNIFYQLLLILKVFLEICDRGRVAFDMLNTYVGIFKVQIIKNLPWLFQFHNFHFFFDDFNTCKRIL